ncbi:sugar phosphate isomerase/epimerase family protein [Marinactinospora thermotolerans]|uniref:Sugar phosphate isomerase/epimerase n=1 Tax=Marinactinospora thermotolerans DSM 45154 TaxID=1122192 RepID=A0A1T4JZX8_9ACTN|nr:sugar phosphate isomerase/epimerase [Marinactinospora thermotolerans]SJZ35585.1 Sugar phosphate isomerase/epimerase [Marinactinospora thermotolerans DSM 45154]
MRVTAPGDDLTVSSLTLRGARDLRERLEAAAEAGFTGVGLSLDDLRRARRSGHDDRDVLALLDELGLRVTEVELLSDWAGGEPGEREAALFAMALTFGAERVHTGLPDPLSPGVDLVAAYARLCERAAARGVRLALEFMPYGAVPSLPRAWELARGGDPRHSGLLVDAWHWHRAAGTAADLAPIPPERIVAVQVCDCRARPCGDLAEEARHHRLLPGDGVADVRGFLRLLRGHGVTAPVGVEVASDDLDGLGARIAARRAYSATAALLASAGPRP